MANIITSTALIAIAAAMPLRAGAQDMPLLHASLVGTWNEQYKRTGRYYLPFNIELHADSTAKFYDRHPDQSYGLRFSVSADSVLSFTNRSQYKIEKLQGDLLRVRSLRAPGRIVLTLKRSRPVPAK